MSDSKRYRNQKRIKNGTRVYARNFWPWARGEGVVKTSRLDPATGIRLYDITLDKSGHTNANYDWTVTPLDPA